MAWYKRNARDLPWRQTRDPYRVWVSEIMLQQTQVVTVVPYFLRFIASFPTVTDLAAAAEEAVLRHWEGLGYYRRARQMHRAAQLIVAEHGGDFPSEALAVRRLPGIGRYTAGAILSIAFDAQEPIVEANTMRLYCRLLAWPGDPRSSEGQELLWSLAKSLVPRRGAGTLNQALMELGATVCLPRSPRCGQCPLASLCPTRAQGLQESIPRAAARPASEAVREAAVVVERRKKVLLLRRGEGGRWAGLWDFPRFPVEAENDAALARELSSRLKTLAGVCIGPPQKLTTIKHGVTRFRITLECFQARHISGMPASPVGDLWRWISAHELDDYPLSKTGRQIGRLLQAREL